MIEMYFYSTHPTTQGRCPWLAWHFPPSSDLKTQGSFCCVAPRFPTALSSLSAFNWQKERAAMRSQYFLKTLTLKLTPITIIRAWPHSHTPNFKGSSEWGQALCSGRRNGFWCTAWNLCPSWNQSGTEVAESANQTQNRVWGRGN